MRGERRRYFRLDALVVPQSVRRVDARGHALESLDAQLVEISGGGARLGVIGGRVHAGHRLVLCFTLAGEVSELTGSVVWTEPVSDPDTPHGAVMAGVGFDDGDASLRRRIVASMNEHRRRHGLEAAGVARRLR